MFTFCAIIPTQQGERERERGGGSARTTHTHCAPSGNPSDSMNTMMTPIARQAERRRRLCCRQGGAGWRQAGRKKEKERNEPAAESGERASSARPRGLRPGQRRHNQWVQTKKASMCFLFLCLAPWRLARASARLRAFKPALEYRRERAQRYCLAGSSCVSCCSLPSVPTHYSLTSPLVRLRLHEPPLCAVPPQEKKARGPACTALVQGALCLHCLASLGKKKQKIHHRNFAKDHSIHYYCSPLELHYGGLMGSGWFARV